MESRAEWDNRWSRFIPQDASALVTFTAGLLQQSSSKDPNNRAQLAGLIAGGAWIVTDLALSAAYRPYDSDWERISPMPKRSEREQLTRERFSEEALDSAASMTRRLSWLSFATNAATGVYMVSKADADLGKIGAASAIAAALAPLVFPTRYQEVACDQQNYKKKIYAPVASATLFTTSSGQIVPGAALSFQF